MWVIYKLKTLAIALQNMLSLLYVIGDLNRVKVSVLQSIWVYINTFQ
jgi:hypothetical protein